VQQLLEAEAKDLGLELMAALVALWPRWHTHANQPRPLSLSIDGKGSPESDEKNA
jgi:hypothetical protein